jgi:hypothetical protein
MTCFSASTINPQPTDMQICTKYITLKKMIIPLSLDPVFIAFTGALAPDSPPPVSIFITGQRYDLKAVINAF